MVRPMQVSKAGQFSKLWLHEAQRVFFDRLVNVDDLVLQTAEPGPAGC